jgi:GGDEF domain-containing protein
VTRRVGPCAARWLRPLLWLLCGVLFGAPLQAAQDAVLVQRLAWVEEGTTATVADVVLRHADRFVPVPDNTIHPLGPERTLWLRLRLLAPPGPEVAWGLEVPVPLLDRVVLHQRGPDGGWSRQQAGDSLPVAQWARPGRHAAFELVLPPGQAREVLLEVRQQYPIGFPVRVAPAAVLEEERQVGYLVLGLIFGTLALMASTCLILGLMHREAAFAWYALYAGAMALTIAAVAGVGGHLLWNGSPRWNHLSQGMVPAFMAGINILFLRHLCAVAGRHPRVDRLALAAGALVLVLGAAFPLAGQTAQSQFLTVAFVASLVLTFTLGGLAWRRGDTVGRWVVLAYLPMAAAIVVALLRIQGWMTANWLSMEATAVAAALAVPLLLLALNARSADRLALQARVNRLTQQDALTGLLAAPAFEKQLKAAVSGVLMRREAAAVVLVELVNLDDIRRAWGDAMAEQAVLRAVIKLHRFVRESEPAGRLGAGRFGLVFEGVHSRGDLQERMVRLVASGLVPTRGATLDVPLRFHVAAVLLGERLRTHELILRDLDRLLAGMSPRTRRPIRFLEADSGAAPPSTVLPGGDADETEGRTGPSTGGSAPPPSSGGAGPSG